MAQQSILRGLREAKGISLRELAELSGVPFNVISRVERGQQPKMKHARALAHALGVTVDFLWPEDQERAS